MKTATATVVAILVGALGALAAETYVDHRGLPASAVHHSKGVRLNCKSGLTRVCFYVHPPVSVACGIPDQPSNWYQSSCSGNVGDSSDIGVHGSTKPFYGQGDGYSSAFSDAKSDVTNVDGFGIGSGIPEQGYTQFVEDYPIKTGGFIKNQYPIDNTNVDYVPQPGNIQDIIYKHPLLNDGDSYVKTGGYIPTTGNIDNIPEFTGSVAVPNAGQIIDNLPFSDDADKGFNYIPGYEGDIVKKWPETVYNNVKWPSTGVKDEGTFHILPYYGDKKEDRYHILPYSGEVNGIGSTDWPQGYPNGDVKTHVTGESYGDQFPTGSTTKTVVNNFQPSNNVQEYAVDIPEYRYPLTPSTTEQQYAVDIPEYRYPLTPSTTEQQYAVDIPEYRYPWSPSTTEQQYAVDIPQYRYPWSPSTYEKYNQDFPYNAYNGYGNIGIPSDNSYYYYGHPFEYSSYYHGPPTVYRYHYPKTYVRSYQLPYSWNHYGDSIPYYPFSQDWGYSDYDYPWWNHYTPSYRYYGYSDGYPYKYTSRPYTWKYSSKPYSSYRNQYVNDVSNDGNPLKIALYND